MLCENISKKKVGIDDKRGAQWLNVLVRALAWTGDQTVPAGFESHCGKLRNFGNSCSTYCIFRLC